MRLSAFPPFSAADSVRVPVGLIGTPAASLALRCRFSGLLIAPISTASSLQYFTGTIQGGRLDVSGIAGEIVVEHAQFLACQGGIFCDSRLLSTLTINASTFMDIRESDALQLKGGASASVTNCCFSRPTIGDPNNVNSFALPSVSVLECAFAFFRFQCGHVVDFAGGSCDAARVNMTAVNAVSLVTAAGTSALTFRYASASGSVGTLAEFRWCVGTVALEWLRFSSLRDVAKYFGFAVVVVSVRDSMFDVNAATFAEVDSSIVTLYSCLYSTAPTDRLISTVNCRGGGSMVTESLIPIALAHCMAADVALSPGAALTREVHSRYIEVLEEPRSTRIIAISALVFAGLVFVALVVCLVVQRRRVRTLDVLENYRDQDENKRWRLVWQWAIKQTGPKRGANAVVRPIDDRVKKKPRKPTAARRPVGQEWQMEFGDIRDDAEVAPTDSSESETSIAAVAPPMPAPEPEPEPEPDPKPERRKFAISQTPAAPAPAQPKRSDARLMDELSKTLNCRKPKAGKSDSASDSSSEAPVFKATARRPMLRPLGQPARPKLFSSDSDTGGAGNSEWSDGSEPAKPGHLSSSPSESL